MTVSDGTESAAPTPEPAPAAQEDPTTNLNALEESPAPEIDPAPESVEIEIGGKKYQVHPDLKDGYLMQSDYTRKTQDVSSRNRALDEREAQIGEFAKLTNEEQIVIGQLAAVDRQLAALNPDGLKFNEIDWVKWRRENPGQADRAAKLFRAREGLEQTARANGDQRTQRLQRETDKRLGDTLDFAEKNIVGWNGEMANQLAAFAAKEFGIKSQAEYLAALNPTFMAVLHRAWLGSQQTAQQQQPKPANAAPPASVTPLETVKSRGSPGAKKSLGDMSMEEYAADYQRRQEARRRR